ncbi:MAG: hypothetical protein EXQ79_00440 [Acidimicrobiia bacterium]|nr:hypothetical protein [Acidimicrobiia bacterium]
MSAPTADASSVGLIERLGWRAERRPEPGFAHTLGAAAAAFLVFATFFLIIEITGSDDPTLVGVALNLVLFAGAFVLGSQQSGPVRSAAVTVMVLTPPIIFFFLLLGNGGGGDGDLRVIYVLTLASYAALYLLLWTKGRGIFLGLALLVLFSWVVWEIDNGHSQLPFQDQISSQTDGTQFDLNDSIGSSDNTDATSTAALVIGLIYLAAAAALDRKKLAGVATPFIAVGGIATVAGAVTLVGDSSALAGGLTLAVSGAVVGLVGGLGLDRRFSTWFGVLMVFLGLTVVVGDTADSNLGFAGFFALLAIALAVAANFVAPKLHEFVDGDVNAGKTSDSA